jgi:hypothetical protein
VCFGNCRGYTNVFVDPNNDSAYGCACSNEVISSGNGNVPTDQCSGYNRMVYSHTPGDYVYGSAAKSLTRRTNRERLQRKTKRKAFCPDGYTACNVGSNGGGAFEVRQEVIGWNEPCDIMYTVTAIRTNADLYSVHRHFFRAR